MTNNKHNVNKRKKRTFFSALMIVNSILTFAYNVKYTHSFISIPSKMCPSSATTFSTLTLFSSPKKKNVDPLRSENRASLHPTTINVISQALLQRSTGKLPSNTPLELANEAGKIAVDALEKRRVALLADDDEEMTAEEWQAVAGRVVGVILRFKDLEQMLCSRVANVEWVKKYQEYDSFGLLNEECTTNSSRNEEHEELSSEVEKMVFEQIQVNPLFRMNRAECLLALFLMSVEAPQLDMLQMNVPGGSSVNFLEQDKLDVLKQE